MWFTLFMTCASMAGNIINYPIQLGIDNFQITINVFVIESTGFFGSFFFFLLISWADFLSEDEMWSEDEKKKSWWK